MTNELKNNNFTYGNIKQKFVKNKKRNTHIPIDIDTDFYTIRVKFILFY